MSVGVVVAAAGQGKRMKRHMNKQFILLRGRPILVHTLQALEALSVIDQIVVVTGEGDLSRCETLCRTSHFQKVSHIVPGGTSRQESVRIGLGYLHTEWAMIHDGARPFITMAHMGALIATAQKHGSAVLGVPVKDTIKKVGVDGVIEETPDRNTLWAVQTPQVFRRSELVKAHESAVREALAVTDDAMLMEHMGFDVRMVQGHEQNIKITTPEDMWFAEAILTFREKMGD